MLTKKKKLIFIILFIIWICGFSFIDIKAQTVSNENLINIDIQSNQAISGWFNYDFENDSNVVDLKNSTIELDNINYIHNFIYFKSDPLHATHNQEYGSFGTCTSIAMQMLLGYHNYYSDRRIIPIFDNEGIRFLDESYGKVNKSPELSYVEEISEYPDSIGTLTHVYDKLIEMNSIVDVPFLGQNVFSMAVTANTFVEEFSTCDSESVHIYASFYNQSEVISEIDCNRPVILGMEKYGEEANQVTFHVVVAYGYAYNNGTLGYITHFGTESSKVSMWVPASYFSFQITMNVEHEHSFISQGTTKDAFDNEIYFINECTECGCILADCFFEMSDNGDEILSIKESAKNSLLNNKEKKLEIPAVVRGINVLYIGDYAFSNIENVLSIILPNGIIEIGNNVFENCISLKSINLDALSQLKKIGSYSFKNCYNINNISIPIGVTYIGPYAFENCTSLKMFSFNNNLSQLNYINDGVFKNCTSLININIPSSITIINKFAFQNCTALKMVQLSENIIEIDSSAFIYCENLENINFGNSITKIGSSAFEGCTMLGDLTFPDSLCSIGGYAFKNCANIVNIIVNKDKGDIISLGNGAFDYCNKLNAIIIPNNKVIRYINSPNWYDYRSFIVSPVNYGKEYIDCQYQSPFKDLEINSGIDNIVQVISGCSKTYKFIFTADKEINVFITNAYYVIFNPEISYKNQNKIVEITVHLTKGTYYFDVFFNDENYSGTVSFEHQVVYPVQSYPANLGMNNVLLHLHENDSGKKNNFLKLDNFTAGFYIFKLIVQLENEGTEITCGEITLFDDINKNSISVQYAPLNNGTVAYSDCGLLYAYISNYNGPIYINVELENNQYSSAILLIEEVNKTDFNLFDLNDLSETSILKFNNTINNDFFEKISLNQICKYKFDLNGFISGYLVVVKELEIGSNEKDIRIIFNNSINKIEENFILEEGVYYIGYVNAQFNEVNSFEFLLEINNTSGTNIYHNGGSEVTINGGENGDNTITQGFTRILYLTSGESRLDYYWFTNNESASRITNVGTLIALNVNSDVQIKIMAINKNDPSIILQKDYIIKKETNIEAFPIYELQEPIVLSLSDNQNMKIDISLLDVPINWLQYYLWTTSSTNITVDQYGIIKTSNNVEPGDYIITGEYKLNPRVTIKIHLKVIN